MPPRILSSLCALCLLCASAVNSFSQPRTRGPFPPKGDPIAPAERRSLETSLNDLQFQITTLQTHLKDHPQLVALLPDVQIFHKAVAWPLQYDEPLDVKTAKRALEMGMERAGQLKKHKAPWLTEGGIRAYRSKIDDSIQPYVVEMPKKFDASRIRIDNPQSAAGNPFRLDFFFHGRDERLTELKFILGKRPEAPTHPTDEKRFLVYTYGRYCNANKFAGEIDTFEVLDAMKRDYPIDENRVIITGFSMGGAAAWHHAVHYTDRWAAASPGAGFAETRVYQNMESTGEWASLSDWQRKLHHLYDCTDYVVNLAMLPTIPYAGELDKQRQSGDLMEQHFGRKLERIWGPKTEHKYDPGAKAEIAKRLDAYAAKGRNTTPRELHFMTHTLRYNRMHWFTIDALNRHWDKARVTAHVTGYSTIRLELQNVAAFTIHFPPGKAPFNPGRTLTLQIDGKDYKTTQVAQDKSLAASMALDNGIWKLVPTPNAATSLRKRHGLQGPIDDAFLEPFLIVKPTGQPLNPTLARWTDHELNHAIKEWRAIFRGEPRVKDDTALTDADIANHNLILFGDPSSNATLAQIADKLPIKWTKDRITLNNQPHTAANHAVVMIYPSPLNPAKYVVLNSGFTFRPPDHRTNSRQIPKLPDYAIFDVAKPPTPDSPGKVVSAGFFDESWQLPPKE